MNLISSNEFTAESLQELLTRANRFKKNHDYSHLRGYTLATIGQHRASMTGAAVPTAMHKLGGEVVSGLNGHSSADILHIYAAVTDGIAVWSDGNIQELFDIGIPTLNCGCEENIGQAVIDLYTIRKELGRWDDLQMLAFGDITNSKALRSLRNLWTLLVPDIKITTIDRLFEDKYGERSDGGIPNQIYVQQRMEQFKHALKNADILYIVENREYFNTDRADHNLKVNKLTLTHLKENAIIMHPMARGPEMDVRVDNDPRIRIWAQARYALPVSMAMLETMMLESVK